jgi:hypothetical protein
MPCNLYSRAVQRAAGSDCHKQNRGAERNPETGNDKDDKPWKGGRLYNEKRHGFHGLKSVKSAESVAFFNDG